MNSKRTNFIVCILNIIVIISTYILAFSCDYLTDSMMSVNNMSKSVYNSFIIDFLVNNVQIVLALVNGGVGILNIICAIQNKENKKLFFWQLILGLLEIWTALVDGFFIDNDGLIDLSSKIISIIAIVLALVNFIRIRKIKPTRIRLVSYVGIIIIAILDLLNIFGAHWDTVSIIMLFIYTYLQDKEIEENGAKRILNIILYYVIDGILVVSFFLMTASSIVISKTNEIRWDRELKELYNNITTLKESTNKELFIPVEKNKKYGFINKDSKEIIPCEYDLVTFFNEIAINGNNYYIALVKTGDKYYIISKNNDKIELNGNLTTYLNRANDFMWEKLTKKHQKNIFGTNYITSFEFLFSGITKSKDMKKQEADRNSLGRNNKVLLTESESKYLYKKSNYSMEIEVLDDEVDDINEDAMFSIDAKHKVTIKKENGEVKSEIVYLPGLVVSEDMLETFKNGFVEFYSIDGMSNGWFDDLGNQIVLPKNYELQGFTDNKIIVAYYGEESSGNDENVELKNQYYILDTNGRILLETPALDSYENTFLLKNKNNKMVIVDKDLNQISNEYDKIITTTSIDITPSFTSYYGESKNSNIEDGSMNN